MANKPPAPSNSPSDDLHVAHPCQPFVRFGACGTFCAFLRATLFGDHFHKELQIAVTGVDADVEFRRRLHDGRWTHSCLQGAHVIVIPPGVSHGAHWRGSACLISMLVDEDFSISAAGSFVRDVSIRPLRRYCEAQPLIGELCAQFWKNCQQPGAFNNAVVGSLAEALSSQILSARFVPPDEGDNQKWLLVRSKLAAVRAHVQENLSEHHTLESLAGIVGLNPSYFGQVFKAATGLPPMAYVTGVRVRQARELLRTGEHTATSVAYMVGFSSQPVMNTAFRRLLGTVPSDYLPKGEKFHGQIKSIRKRPRWAFH